RLRHRAARGGGGEAIRAVFFHQAGGHGHGVADQPRHRGGAWRPAVGHPQRRARCHLSLYPADGCGGYRMSEADAVVFVVDDDPAFRDALTSLLRSVGLAVETFGSAQEFLNRHPPDGPACLVLDVRLPGLSGLDLQRALATAQLTLPIIFLTGYGDIPMTVRAMKAGAVEFLTKPFRDQ